MGGCMNSDWINAEVWGAWYGIFLIRQEPSLREGLITVDIFYTRWLHIFFYKCGKERKLWISVFNSKYNISWEKRIRKALADKSKEAGRK